MTAGPDLTPWPAADAARYRALGYWQGQTFGTWLSGLAEAYAERTAVVGVSAETGEQVRWTYAELDERAHRLAAGLVDTGIADGQRVIVQLPNVAEYVPVIFALWRAGALPVFALPAHRRSELTHFAAHAEASAIITVGVHERHDFAAEARAVAGDVPSVRHVLAVGSAEFAELAAAEPKELADPDPSGLAFLQLSGGSTGMSKLIPRTHDDYLYSVRESARICRLRPDSVYLVVLPVAHNYPMSSPGILGALHSGATVVLSPRPDADTAFGLIEAEGVTMCGVVPPLAAAWVQAAGRTKRDLSTLEVLLVGGAKCGRELAERIEPALGCRLQQVFGMAEGLVFYTRLDDPDELVLSTQGRPISLDDEIRVVDPDDPEASSADVVEPGQAGALLTRGPYTIRGYYRAAEHNASAFTADGFYRTGDLVKFHPSGHVEVVGRVKEQINRGGEKVAPEEVENHLMAHPSVVDAAVVGVADDYLGERTCAYVVAADGAEPAEAELRRFVRERGVAAYKIPDRVVLTGRFPTTGVGKTSKRELRALLAAQAKNG
ncbi:2,3-dihydroxybenzoate-AMP ligase [Saccharomonospora sp. CUA-673]|uniref:(2,3-dihydroxybenzoyl)adenylate synthase n=1 Tax=Saccharomonospora sp. CUA-673 TaxID=1904969 RepID=UPI0009596B4A|nr:AMP-binding protein [Saccharomonospora sp. CUA-673]OLT44714.1 2,3-dihydroxybenzoate-AMP ligase [Saccharomonospora sp. CUA-673]